ncbi:hypothetical protein JHK85_019284 [Glycine max]|nr:hypothetical protein JHK85_019284 [Glycine max]
MERLVAFACIEGIFFSGSYCVIFWLEKSCHASITIAMTSWWPHVARPYAGGIKGTYHPSWRVDLDRIYVTKLPLDSKTISKSLHERLTSDVWASSTSS